MELLSSLLSLGAGNQDEHSGESNPASGVTFTPSVPYFFFPASHPRFAPSQYVLHHHHTDCGRYYCPDGLTVMI